jgi:hypothetical protein
MTATSTPLAYAADFVRRVCQLAGPTSFIRDLRAELRSKGVLVAVQTHDSAALFDWLMVALSFQGIADRIAAAFIAEHGNVAWRQIESSLAESPSCPKLTGHWTFYGCSYHKGSGTCAEPEHVEACPLPRHNLRNGHLNQTAYSLFLFIRDVMGGDLVAWIDEALVVANNGSASRQQLADLRKALIEPLRHIHGVSDKVLAVALSTLLIGAGKLKPLWLEVGTTFVAVDTLVHNFLHRTGILHRFGADHAYGAGCYHARGCADLIEIIAAEIDARAFNPSFPSFFPRFVQSAIWHYCAANGFDVCNGNRIDDRERCNNNVYCRLHGRCDRLALHVKLPKKLASSAV